MNSLYKSERRKCLSNFMLLNNFDVICICETWLTTDVNDSELFLANYTIFRSDRVSKLGATSHGGTMICVKDSTNWLQCERCRQWAHSSCMGYTVEEFNFLGKSKNVLFVRDECLADGTAHALDTVNSLSLEIVNLKNSVGEIKEAVCNGSQEKVTQELQELKSVVQEVKQTTAVTSEAKLHFPIPKSKTDYNFELRFSGIPEFISSTKSANRKDVFEHDEKLLK